MKTLLKPYRLLFGLLMIIHGFCSGLLYARLTDAGEDQMLAAAAMVLGYGFTGALTGFITALFLSRKIPREMTIQLNKIFTLFLLLTIAFYSFQSRNQEKSFFVNEPVLKEVTPFSAAGPRQAVVFTTYRENIPVSSSGMGMFIPDFYKNNVLYFYNNPNLEKAVREHLPTDSITFQQNEYGQFEIATAPPWLVPDHLKLDYDMLYFKIQSVGSEFIEVTVNTNTEQTSFVNRQAGKIEYWPEFLLHVHSVEFPRPAEHSVYIKPLAHASTLTTEYSFLRPVRIKGNWMYVDLLDSDFKAFDHGWIQWIENGELLIGYSLLS